MNIFYLANDPAAAARYHCDKHVVKMILESAQLLSTAHHVVDGSPSIECYKMTHKNHPSAVWARQNREQYYWLHSLLHELCKEYTLRYGKVHKVQRSGLFQDLGYYPNELRGGVFVDPPQCMPDQYKVENDAVQAYRNYYIGDKIEFAVWRHTATPDWWPYH